MGKYSVSQKKTVKIIEKVLTDTEKLEDTNVPASIDAVYGKIVTMYIDRATNDLIVIYEE